MAGIKSTVTRKRMRRPNIPQMVKEALLAAGSEVAAKAHAEALNLTDGRISSLQLAAWGHPFGRNYAGSVNVPPLPINRQSGQLQESLKVRVQRYGYSVLVRLTFTSLHALVLAPDGLEHMVERGFQYALKTRVAPTFIRARQALLRRMASASG